MALSSLAFLFHAVLPLALPHGRIGFKKCHYQKNHFKLPSLEKRRRLWLLLLHVDLHRGGWLLSRELPMNFWHASTSTLQKVTWAYIGYFAEVSTVLSSPKSVAASAGLAACMLEASWHSCFTATFVRSALLCSWGQNEKKTYQKARLWSTVLIVLLLQLILGKHKNKGSQWKHASHTHAGMHLSVELPKNLVPDSPLLENRIHLVPFDAIHGGRQLEETKFPLQESWKCTIMTSSLQRLT